MASVQESLSPSTTTAQATGIPTQYSLGKILAVWAAAAAPMGLFAWVVAPWLAGVLDGPAPLGRSLLVLLAAGLVWQGVLVAWLVWREQRSLRWTVVRESLWLRAPRSPRTGRVGGRVWWVVIPFALLFYAEGFVPTPLAPAARDFGAFLASPAGETFFSGAWGWYGLLIVMWLFNTVLGEELLFRGLLLPRMNGVFGRGDWVANGILFAAYHVHMPWAIPGILLDTFTLAYPTKRYRSAWIGIAVHSMQSIFLALVVLTMVV